jgi:outer membrane receptor protein involved in Fe transport
MDCGFINYVVPLQPKNVIMIEMKRLYLCFSAILFCMNGLAGGVSEVVNDTSRVVDLDEVVIVAQPKEQTRLRLQPLSSSVFGEEQMLQLNVRDLSQLSQYVPSFSMPAYGSRLTSSMYMRGIGSRINNPAVGVYYDNIPLMSKAAYNNHFYMLDRVDVLRGPQGTLYGQNTEGGLVRVYSKNPMSYQGTDIRLGIGTGLYSNVEVAHYHRPSEKLAFSVAGFYSGLKGFIDNQNF